MSTQPKTRSIVDCHAYLCGPDSLNAQLGIHLAQRGAHGSPIAVASADEIESAAQASIQFMDDNDIDVQIISASPMLMLFTGMREREAMAWFRSVNDVAAQVAAAEPARLRLAPWLPLHAGMQAALDELTRCLDEYRVNAVVINPDPSEGLSATPRMGDEYWFELYERLDATSTVGLVRPSKYASARRHYLDHWFAESSLATLSLAQSRVFERFADLQLVLPYGGGSVPYQIGRWRSQRIRRADSDSSFDEPIEASLRRLWFDTTMLSDDSLRLLLQIVGPERCLYGSGFPGAGWSARTQPAARELQHSTKGQRALLGALPAATSTAVLTDNAAALFHVTDSLTRN